MKILFKQKTIPDIRCSIAKYCKLISILSPSKASSVFQFRLYKHTRLIIQEIYHPLVKKTVHYYVKM